MRKILLQTDSMTAAMKGRDLLRKNGLRADIQRVGNPSGHAGCSYGVAVFGVTDTEAVAKILSQAGITVRKWYSVG